MINLNYYPFGMLMPNRYGDADNYRYGLHGMEKDDEVKGSGNSYTTFFRQYDPRVGKWLSIDPKDVAWESPYAAYRNNPIFYNDPHGDCPDGKCPDVDLSYGKNVKKDNIQDSSLQVVNDISKSAGVESLKITSAGRDVGDQARIMFNNLEDGNVIRYRQPGQNVTKVYFESKKANMSSDEIKQAMISEINKYGPGEVSRHMADPSKFTVLDIAPSSIDATKRKAFMGAIKEAQSKGLITQFLHPGNSSDRAYHIVIPVLKKTNHSETSMPVNNQMNTIRTTPKSPIVAPSGSQGGQSKESVMGIIRGAFPF